MRNIHSLGGLLLAGAMVGTLSGCYVGETTPAGYYVTEAPPPPQVEYVPAAPGPDYVWIGGNWGWHNRWEWEHGRWERRPHAHARWAPGRWEHGRGGYSWREGHWR